MFIDGAYNVLYIDYGDGFFPVGCLTSNGISEEVEILDSTTRDNLGWKTGTPTNQSYSIDFSGLSINTIYAKGDFLKISYDRLKIIKRARQLIDWKIQDVDLQFIETGKGYITSLDSESNIDEFISFSANLQGYGIPTSTTGIEYSIENGDGGSIQDGNNNSIEA